MKTREMQKQFHTSILCWVLLVELSHTAMSCQDHNRTLSMENVTNIVRFLIKQENNKLCRPYRNDYGPLVVTSDLNLVSISNFREENMEFSVELYFRQTWHDPRLAYSHRLPGNYTTPYVTLYGDLSANLWQPDTYFENEVDGKLHELTIKNKYMRVYGDGLVMTSTRLTLACSCSMDFRKFPMDVQKCGISFASYGYTSVDIVYKWAPDRVAWTPDQEIAQFNLEKILMIDLTREYLTGNFSALGIQMLLRRRLGHYVTRVYVPTVLIVMLSWLSFYLDRHSAPARVSLGITTVLTMTTLLIGIGQGSLPVVSYVKAIDWYLFVSYCMVFGAFAEYALMNYREKSYLMGLQRRAFLRRNENGSVNQLPKTNYSSDMIFNPGNEHTPTEVLAEALELREPTRQTHDETQSRSCGWLRKTFITPPGMIDEWSKKLFPLIFIVFNLVYWIFYLFVLQS